MTGTLDRLAAVVAGEGFSTLRCPRARVLLVLLLYGGESGTAEPSLARVSELARVDLRNTRRALRELEDADTIRRRASGGGRGRTTVYEVVPAAQDGALHDFLERQS